jgi:hypothetical protein
VKAADFFSLPASLASFASFFPADVAPWEWLKHIGAALAVQDFSGGQSLPPGIHAEGPVYVHPTAQLPSYATLLGPIWVA